MPCGIGFCKRKHIAEAWTCCPQAGHDQQCIFLLFWGYIFAAVLCLPSLLKVVNRKLNFASWLVAWDRYVIAAVATGQFTWAAGLHHKEVVTEIAMGAHVGDCSLLLGVFYDEEAR